MFTKKNPKKTNQKTTPQNLKWSRNGWLEHQQGMKQYNYNNKHMEHFMEYITVTILIMVFC